MKIKFGEPCPICDTEVIKITREALNQMIETLSPVLHSVSKNQINGNRAQIPICPGCDAYALGIELTEGFPFLLKDGRESGIQQIADMLWQSGRPFRSKNLQNRESDRDTDAVGDAQIDAKNIVFPYYKVPEIDWDEVEEIRNKHCWPLGCRQHIWRV